MKSWLACLRPFGSAARQPGSQAARQPGSHVRAASLLDYPYCTRIRWLTSSGKSPTEIFFFSGSQQAGQPASWAARQLSGLGSRAVMAARPPAMLYYVITYNINIYIYIYYNVMLGYDLLIKLCYVMLFYVISHCIILYCTILCYIIISQLASWLASELLRRCFGGGCRGEPVGRKRVRGPPKTHKDQTQHKQYKQQNTCSWPSWFISDTSWSSATTASTFIIAIADLGFPSGIIR